MIQQIIEDVDKLSFRSQEINIRKDGKYIRATVVDLKDTIREYNLLGLAAIQIDVPARIFVVNFQGKLQSFCNAVITNCSGLVLQRQKCPSIPNKEYIVPRYEKLTIMYQTPLGEIKSANLVGMAATTVQELVDHTEGVLISDIGLEIDSQFDSLTEQERQQLVHDFLDSIDVKLKDITTEIQNDNDLNKLKNASEFIKGVNSGNIELGEFITETKQENEDESNNS